MAPAPKYFGSLCGYCHRRIDEKGDAASIVPFQGRQSLLSKYFDEVAGLSVLQPEEELERAREIERLEAALWSQILSHPGLLSALLALIADRLDSHPSGLFRALKKSAGMYRKRPTKATRKHFAHQRDKAGGWIRSMDADRELLDEVHTKLKAISRRESRQIGKKRVRINPGSRSFEAYRDRIEDLYTRSLKARNDFVRANLRLVVTIARRYYFGQLSFQDLIQEGNIGLIKAVGRFDHRRGYRFSTYATWWIRHAVTRGLADKGRLVKLPVYFLDNRQRVTRAQHRLAVQLGRPPTRAEICRCTGLEMSKVEQLQASSRSPVVSLDTTIDEEGSRRYIDLLWDPDSPLPSEPVMANELLQKVESVFDRLKPIEVDVVRRRFGLDDGRVHSLAEIGRAHHLSRERIRQIQNEALAKIRHALRIRRVI